MYILVGQGGTWYNNGSVEPRKCVPGPVPAVPVLVYTAQLSHIDWDSI